MDFNLVPLSPVLRKKIENMQIYLLVKLLGFFLNIEIRVFYFQVFSIFHVILFAVLTYFHFLLLNLLV